MVCPTAIPDATVEGHGQRVQGGIPRTQVRGVAATLSFSSMSVAQDPEEAGVTVHGPAGEESHLPVQDPG